MPCPQDHASATPGEAPHESRPTTVLVVDDSAVDREAAGQILRQRADLRVEYAGGGREALAMIERCQPMVIVTALQMPDMDGLELVSQIRARYGMIPVILVTAPGSEVMAMQALRAGATNYVPKQELARELLETLDRVLSVAVHAHRRERLMACLEERSTCFRLGNDVELIAPLVHLLQEELDITGFCDETTRTRVGIALTEALTNAVYHGNLQVSSDLRQEDEGLFFAEVRRRRVEPPYRDRAIHVRATIDREAATYRIQDEGPGFDISRVCEPPDAEAIMRIGGRGLLLIRTFMDEVTLEPPGNRITMVLRRRAADLGAGESRRPR